MLSNYRKENYIKNKGDNWGRNMHYRRRKKTINYRRKVEKFQTKCIIKRNGRKTKKLQKKFALQKKEVETNC